jgi:hypothetical protein
MEKSSKRGKIPQSDWPLIMARYEAGETLSSIARTYDCSPPAISYVVSRSRARQAGGETPRPAAAAGEPQLIKATAGNGADATGNRDSAAMPPGETAPPAYPAITARPPEPAPVHPNPIAPQAGPAGDRRFEIRPGNGNGFVRPGLGPVIGERAPQAANPFAPSAPSAAPRPADPQPAHVQASHGPPAQGPANSDPRGRLHLSLGNGSHANGGSQPAEPRVAEGPQPPMPPQNGGGERAPAWPAPTPHHYPGLAEQHRHAMPPAGAPMRVNGGQQGPFGRGEAQTEHRKEGGGAFIDAELRARVDSDIAAFLSAFDMALAEDTPESRALLREATDRLLRAGARTRIELERLEARMPLPPRDTGRQEPTWRQR